ncbi:MAG: hypothetical protein ACR2M3_15800 [Thermomicrobiales bacterium]
MERILATIGRFFARVFPPVEKPAMTPLRGRRGHTTSSIAQDFVEEGYHGNPDEDDKWPDKGGKP